jgi:hypothetical protein
MKNFDFKDFILLVAVGLPLLIILVSLFYLIANFLTT